jgi:hypothetical protein
MIVSVPFLSSLWPIHWFLRGISRSFGYLYKSGRICELYGDLDGIARFGEGTES